MNTVCEKGHYICSNRFWCSYGHHALWRAFYRLSFIISGLILIFCSWAFIVMNLSSHLKSGNTPINSIFAIRMASRFSYYQPNANWNPRAHVTSADYNWCTYFTSVIIGPPYKPRPTFYPCPMCRLFLYGTQVAFAVCLSSSIHCSLLHTILRPASSAMNAQSLQWATNYHFYSQLLIHFDWGLLPIS